ncbi:hypothetical protein YC2023_008610 [Brassica napus]
MEGMVMMEGKKLRGNRVWIANMRGLEVQSATRNPQVVSDCPKAHNPHLVSDCQPSNPPGPEPAGTNTHYPKIRHQRRDNFKLGEGLKRSVATGGIRTRVRIGVLMVAWKMSSRIQRAYGEEELPVMLIQAAAE